MNTILTDDERRAAIKSVRHGMFTEPVPDDVARAVEAAVLAKLREPQEPVRRQCVVCDTVYEDGVPPQVAAPQQADRQRVPEGWKLVPVEPVAWMQPRMPEKMRGPATRTAEAYGFVNGWNACVDAMKTNAAPEAPAQRKKVGDSRFESWFSEDFDPKNKGTKQQMREAYEAGMSDSAPAPAQASAVDEREAFEAWWKSEHRLKSDSAAQAREAFHAGAAHARGETAV